MPKASKPAPTKPADSAFEARYARLNPRQREAVDAVEGPVMVIAGPGTGKTTILTLRIANILRQTDTPPSGILAITYTDAGAKAMKQALRAVVGSRADEVRIHTFHSLAASLIAEFGDHFPHLSKARQATDTEIQALVRKVLKDKRFAKLRPLGDPDLFIPKIVAAVSESKREAWTPDMLRAHAKGEIERIKADPESISSRGATKGGLKADALKAIEKAERTILLAEAYQAYEDAKKAARLMDYDDLLSELLRALREDELFLRLVQEKFLYISVDEHQDTNDAQNAIIRAIADFFDEPNLFIVGDEKQAIYRFQGASVENFLTFQKAWKSMRVISLSDNYRSHQSILDAGYSLIDRNYAEGELAELRVPLAAGGKAKARPIDVVEGGNVEASEAYLVRELKAIAEDHPEKTVAVIARRNRDVSRVAAALEAAGIQASADRGADVLKHPVGILFFRLANALRDPSAVEDLAATVAGGLWDLPFAKRAELIRAVRAGKLDGVEEAIPRLAELRAESTRAGALAFLIRMGHESGLVPLALRDPLAADVWRALVSISARLVQESGLDSPAALLQSLMEYEAAAESRGVKIRVGLPDAQVSVMTAHSSKGLEFDYVYVMDATEEAWMGKPRASYFVLPREASTDDGARDARRLFYVALTRAREHASILYGLEGDDGRALTPVRFIDEIDARHVSKASLPPARERALALDAKAAGRVRDEARVGHAMRAVLDDGVSVSALNNFLKCPSTFYMRNILRLPEAPNASSEKGNAMHAAISSVWDLDVRTPKAITAELEKSVREYFSRSLLAAFDKDAAEAELLEAAPKVAAALAPHFAQEGEVATEKWFEMPFVARYEGKDVPIRLHGRMDAVVTTEKAARVFDYKTREALSEAAIRGETKDSTGDYLRQLAFYTMLLKADSNSKGKAIEASLVFVKPDRKGACPTVSLPIEAKDIGTVEAALRGLVDSVWSGKVLSSRCDDPDCAYCAMLGL